MLESLFLFPRNSREADYDGKCDGTKTKWRLVGFHFTRYYVLHYCCDIKVFWLELEGVMELCDMR